MLGARAKSVERIEQKESFVDFSRLKKELHSLPPSLKKLGLMLSSGNGGLREEATECLVKKGSKSAKVLRLTLHFGDTMPRAAASEALCRIVNKRHFKGSLDLVIWSLLDPSPYVQWRTMEHLGKACRTSKTVHALLNTNLQDENELVRLYAAKAIGRLGVAHMLDNLWFALGSKMELSYVKGAILEAISELEKHKSDHFGLYARNTGDTTISKKVSPRGLVESQGNI